MINKKSSKINQTIIISFIISLILTSFLLLSISIPTISQNNIVIPKTSISFNPLNERNRDDILRDQALIFDTKPIFLPSEWNTKDIKSNEVDKSLFPDLLAQTTIDTDMTLSKLIHPEIITVLPTDSLKQLLNPFEGINQDQLVFSSFNIPKIHVIIKNFIDSKLIENYEIESENPILQTQFWGPLEFLVIVDESGPVMPLLISQSSGIEDVDLYFQKYISDPLLKLSRLPKGYYKVMINP